MHKSEADRLKRLSQYGKYFAWGITAFAVLACAILFYFGLDYFGALFKAFGSFMGILSPFVIGLIISYLLIPILRLSENKLTRPFAEKLRAKYPKLDKKGNLPRTLSVIIAEIALILVITALFYLIIPQLYESIATIVANSPDYFETAYKTINNLLNDNPVIEKYAEQVFGNLTVALTTWVKDTLLPSMEGVVTNITSGVYYAVKTVYNVVVGIIVSIYVLFNKESFRAHSKRLLYCIFNTKTAKRIGKALKFSDKTFMGFITGKLLDSAIIGLICYIGCLILGIPYALLVSVIVGITNIIPFFGPFIGAIPSALLILLVDPTKCLYFIVFIIVLQQVDGNIIGPKILGGSIGINGFWVMFAIILGGGLFGFWGMLIGVPVFVIIYTGVEMMVEQKLEKENLPIDTELYEDLDYIDPKTGEMIMRTKTEEEVPKTPEKTKKSGKTK